MGVRRAFGSGARTPRRASLHEWAALLTMLLHCLVAGAEQALSESIPQADMYASSCANSSHYNAAGWCLGQSAALASGVQQEQPHTPGPPCPSLAGQAFRVTRELRLTRAVFELVLNSAWEAEEDTSGSNISTHRNTTGFQFNVWLFRMPDGSTNVTLGDAVLVASPAAASPPSSSSSAAASTMLLQSPTTSVELSVDDFVQGADWAVSLPAAVEVEFEFEQSDLAWLLQPGGYYFLGISSNDTKPCSVILPGRLVACDARQRQQQQQEDEGGSGCSSCLYTGAGYCRPPLAECSGSKLQYFADGDEPSLSGGLGDGLEDEHIPHIKIFGMIVGGDAAWQPEPSAAPLQPTQGELLSKAIPSYNNPCQYAGGWCLDWAAAQRAAGMPAAEESVEVRGQGFRVKRPVRLTKAVFEMTFSSQWAVSAHYTVWLYRTTDGSSNFTAENAVLQAASGTYKGMAGEQDEATTVVDPAYGLAFSLWGNGTSYNASTADGDSSWLLQSGLYYYLGISVAGSNDSSGCSAIVLVGPAAGDNAGDLNCQGQQLDLAGNSNSSSAYAYCMPPLAECKGMVAFSGVPDGSLGTWSTDDSTILHVDLYGAIADDGRIAHDEGLTTDPADARAAQGQEVLLSDPVPGVDSDQALACAYAGVWCLGQLADTSEVGPRLRGQAFRVSQQLRLSKAVFELVLGSVWDASYVTNATGFQFTVWLYRTSDGSSRFHNGNAELVVSTAPSSGQLSVLGFSNSTSTMVAFEFSALEAAWILEPSGYYFLGISSNDTYVCSTVLPVGLMAGNNGSSGCGASCYPGRIASCRPPFTDCVGAVAMTHDSTLSALWAVADGHMLHMDIYGSDVSSEPVPPPSPGDAGGEVELMAAIPRQGVDCVYAGTVCLGEIEEGGSMAFVRGQAFRAARAVRLTRAAFKLALGAERTAGPVAGVQFTTWLYRTQDDSAHFTPDNAMLVATATSQTAAILDMNISNGYPGTELSFEFEKSDTDWLLQTGGYYFLGISSNSSVICALGVPYGPAESSAAAGCSAYPAGSSFCGESLSECVGVVSRVPYDYNEPAWSVAPAGTLHMNIYGRYP